MAFLPFYFVFIIILLGGFVDYSARTIALSTFRFWLIVLSLVALAAFRTIGVGSDDLAYVEIFSQIPAITDCRELLCDYDYSKIQVEFGFFGFLSLISLLGKSSFILFLSVAFLSVYLNLKTISFYSPYFGASTLIYYSHFFLAKELNAIRVGLATAIVFYATTFLQKKPHALFFVFVILAVSIHVTSILVLIPIILTRFSPNRLHLIAACIVMLVIASTLNFEFLSSPLLIIGFLQDKMDLYSNSAEYNYNIQILDLVNVKNLLIVSMCLIFWKKLCADNKSFRFSFYFFYCATFFRILFGDFAIVAGRGYAAISMFEYIIVPFLFISLTGKKWGYFLTIVYAASTLYLNLYVNIGWSGGGKYFDNFFN